MDEKRHLVKWATVCSDEKIGGLGFGGVYKLNKALSGKWNWCFANERNSLCLLTEILGRCREDGARGRTWVILGQACEKK